jgi:hypothetical protein
LIIIVLNNLKHIVYQMAIGNRLRQMYMASRMMGVTRRAGSGIGGTLRDGFNAARSIGGAAKERFARKRLGDQEFESRLDRNLDIENVKLEQRQIFEHMLKSMGVHGSVAIWRARRNKKLWAMVETIHTMFGDKLSEVEVREVNRVFQTNLHSNAEFYKNSSGLQQAIKIIDKGKPKDLIPRAFGVLQQACVDLLQKDEKTQGLLQTKSR